MRHLTTSLFALLLLFFSSVQAAGPLFHLYLADKWCDGQEMSVSDKTLALRGSAFPDIRFVAGLPLEATHIFNLSIDELADAPDAFRKGWRHHCWTEDQRDAWIAEHDSQSLVSHISPGYERQLLKFLEDEVIYRHFQQGSYQAVFLGGITPEEQSAGVAHDQIIKWNSNLFIYFAGPPSRLLGFLGKFGRTMFGVPPEVLVEWSQIFPDLANDETIKAHVEGLLEHVQSQY